MGISEEQLRELILRVMKELEAEKAALNRPRLYMICLSRWDERYGGFLREMEQSGKYEIYPVIPVSWQKQGYESELRKYSSCSGIVYRSCERPAGLESAVSVFPVVPRDVLVKTALCIGDTFETSWIADCIEKGGQTVFLRSGLAKFSGKEKPAYRERIMGYCRQVLEYGIGICGVGEISDGDMTGTEAPSEQTEGLTSRTDSDRGKKRVITASNVDQLAAGGVLYLRQDDIVTDLARDRAKFLNIVLK